MFALHKAFQQSTQLVHEAAKAERERRTKMSRGGSTSSTASNPAPGLGPIGSDNGSGGSGSVDVDVDVREGARAASRASSGRASEASPAPTAARMSSPPLPSPLSPGYSALSLAQVSVDRGDSEIDVRTPGTAGSGSASGSSSSRASHHPSRRNSDREREREREVGILRPPPRGDLPPIPSDQSPFSTNEERYVPPPDAIVRTPRRRSSRPNLPNSPTPPKSLPPSPPAHHHLMEPKGSSSGSSSNSSSGGGPRRGSQAASLLSQRQEYAATPRIIHDAVFSIQPSQAPAAAPVQSSNDVVAPVAAVPLHQHLTELQQDQSSSSQPQPRYSEDSVVDPRASIYGTLNAPPPSSSSSNATAAPPTSSSRFRIPKSLRRGSKAAARQSESRGSQASESSSRALSSSPEIDTVASTRLRASNTQQPSNGRFSLDTRSHASHSSSSTAAPGSPGLRAAALSLDERRKSPLMATPTPANTGSRGRGSTDSAGSSFKRRSMALFGGRGSDREREADRASSSGRPSLSVPSTSSLEPTTVSVGGIAVPLQARQSESSTRPSESSSPSMYNSSRDSSNDMARASLSSGGEASALRGAPPAAAAAKAPLPFSSASSASLQAANLAPAPFPRRPSGNNSSLSVPATTTTPTTSSSLKPPATSQQQQPVLLQHPHRARSSSNLLLRRAGSSEMLSAASPRDSLSADATTTPASKGSRLMRGFSNRRPRTATPGGSRGDSSDVSRPSADSAPLDRQPSRPSTAIASTSPSSPLAPRDGSSRLESSGGAAALFGGGGGGGGGSRPRASSLLPNIFGGGNSRARAASTSGRQSPFTPTTAPGSSRGTQSTTPTPTIGGGVGASASNSATVVAAPSSSEEVRAAVPAAPSTKKFPPLQDESPDEYVERLQHTMSDHSDVAAMLASSTDDYHLEALRWYMRRFLFVGNPLDIALRKMLMELRLPKETQQIDRVMEAFAKRYNECNEGLFASDDQPYILAFSLMMLHTDAFNRNAKNKMGKVDYVKNTASSGVPQDILEYLYDNLTFTQFVYSDEVDAPMPMMSPAPLSGGGGGGGFLSSFGGGNKDKGDKTVDAYWIIRQGRLSSLCPNIENVIPEDDPFSFTGTESHLDVPTLARAYMSAPSIEVVASTRRPSVSSAPNPADGMMPGSAWSGPEMIGHGGLGNENDSTLTLRIFKVGIVNRKDEVTEKGKKASRKWKSCGMVLSSSQLLFFRDLVWIDALQAQISEQLADASPEERKRGIIITPKITNFRPDGVLSLGDAIALKDDSFEREESVLRLVGVQGSVQHEYLFQVRDRGDMNEWIAGINFCACFRAAGLKVTNLDTIALMNGDALPMSRTSSNTGSDRQWSNSDPFAPAISPGTSSPPQATPAQLLRAKVAARRRELLPKLEAVTRTLETHVNELQELLRLARQFAIMTPFQRSTRERIEAAATPLAARIRQLRIDVAKYECRHYILASEVQVNDRATANAAAAVAAAAANAENLASPSLLALAQQERKGSYFAAESLSSPSDDGWSRSPIEMRKGSNSGLGPVAEVAGESGIGASPIPTIGSFARFDNGNGSDSASLAPTSGKTLDLRSRISRSRVRGGAPSEGTSSSGRSIHGGSASASGSSGKPPEVAESWHTTRAFRDPDRISVAQLPSIETIEAATREKARRRVAQQPASKGGLFTSYSSTNLGANSSKRKGSMASGSAAAGGASSSGGGNANSTFSYTSHGSGGSNSGREIPVADRKLDPPVFMSTWSA